MTETRPELEVFFLGGARLRFCVLRSPPPSQPLRGAFLNLHPFAEEMNKCRRMMALGAEALAAQGWAVLQIDLSGCGDSEGEFRDASWDQWINDAAEGIRWLQDRFPVPVGIWAVRGGALLLPRLLLRAPVDGPLLLWQAVVSGSQHLTQFLRTKLASRWAVAESPRSARVESGADSSQEVAGYFLSSELAQALAEAELVLPASRNPVIWCEVQRNSSEAGTSPTGQRWIAKHAQAGLRIRSESVPGPHFWQTVETEVAPELLTATIRAVGEFQ